MLLGLADILFAYAYDHRTTTGDASVESAWTVAVLSPLLSWLEVCAFCFLNCLFADSWLGQKKSSQHVHERWLFVLRSSLVCEQCLFHS